MSRPAPPFPLHAARLNMLCSARATIPSYRTVTGSPRRGLHAAQLTPPHFQTELEDERTQWGRATDGQLAHAARELRSEVARAGLAPQSPLLSRAMALLSEALHRVHGWEFYPVQVQAGLALSGGVIAEIQTGEGKTITTAIPTFLWSLDSPSVHVATTNDYLSQRDHEILAPVLSLLGLRCGLLKAGDSVTAKRAAYASSVTFGPGYEFGFDFLRDSIQRRRELRRPLGERFLAQIRGLLLDDNLPLQTHRACMLVDEADCLLVDEATSPLVISGLEALAEHDPQWYESGRECATELQRDVDYHLDRSARTVTLTAAGRDSIAQFWYRQPPRPILFPWPQLVENALRAEHLLQRDVDYVVQGDQVIIVDPQTGRLHPERRWHQGLHQAVEVREGLPPATERVADAKVSRQRYFRLYRRLSGMTGTAAGAEFDFNQLYQLPVVTIPPHRPLRLLQLPARCFVTEQAKLAAVVRDVRERTTAGRPVLIGTRDIAASGQVSRALQQAGIEHAVLNGLQDAHEAAVIARAGTAGAVTVATNMAGRGTDIRLDGPAYQAGGLHVLALQFHTSSRVDRQLAGRAGRQGAPGSCQVMVAADDPFFVEHAPDLAHRIRRNATNTGEALLDLSAAVAAVQHQLEERATLARRQLAWHDTWMEHLQQSLGQA